MEGRTRVNGLAKRRVPPPSISSLSNPNIPTLIPSLPLSVEGMDGRWRVGLDNGWDTMEREEWVREVYPLPSFTIISLSLILFSSCLLSLIRISNRMKTGERKRHQYNGCRKWTKGKWQELEPVLPTLTVGNFRWVTSWPRERTGCDRDEILLLFPFPTS